MKNIGIQFQRVDQETDYTIVSNHILRDNTLSWRARGLFIYILSKPETWKVYTKDLINQATEGKYAMYKAMKELVEAGYIERSQIVEDGKFGNLIYKVYQIPCSKKPYPKKQHTENQSTYKVKNKSNTELINKKEINKEKRIEKQISELEESVMSSTEYPIEMRKEFISYWTEPNRSKTKCRYRMEKTWDTNRRLSTWASRTKGYQETITVDDSIQQEREKFDKSLEVENPATPEEIEEIMGGAFKKLAKGMSV